MYKGPEAGDEVDGAGEAKAERWQVPQATGSAGVQENQDMAMLLGLQDWGLWGRAWRKDGGVRSWSHTGKCHGGGEAQASCQVLSEVLLRQEALS